MNRHGIAAIAFLFALLGGEVSGQIVPKKVLGVTFDAPAICRVWVNGQPISNYVGFEERPEAGPQGMLWVKPGESFYFLRSDAIWNLRRNNYGEVSVAGLCFEDETLNKFIGGFSKKIHDNRYSTDQVMPSVSKYDFVTKQGNRWETDRKANLALGDEPVRIKVPPQPNNTILVSVANIGSEDIKVQMPLNSKVESEILPPGSFRTYRFDYQLSQISTVGSGYNQNRVITILGTFGRQSFVVPLPEQDQWTDTLMVSEAGVDQNMEHVYSYYPTSY